jgi:hypothetical protein
MARPGRLRPAFASPTSSAGRSPPCQWATPCLQGEGHELLMNSPDREDGASWSSTDSTRRRLVSGRHWAAGEAADRIKVVVSARLLAEMQTRRTESHDSGGSGSYVRLDVRPVEQASRTLTKMAFPDRLGGNVDVAQLHRRTERRPAARPHAGPCK